MHRRVRVSLFAGVFALVIFGMVTSGYAVAIDDGIIEGKGDIVVGTAPDTADNKRPGQDGDFLIYDSSQDDGLAQLSISEITPIYYEMDYGSLSAAISQAHDDGGGTVVMSLGDHSGALAISGKDNITLIGHGKGSVIDGDDDTALFLTNCDDWKLINVATKTTAGGGQVAYGFVITGDSTNIQFIGCGVTESDGIAMLVSGDASGIWFNNCYLSGSIDGVGIMTTSGTSEIFINGLRQVGTVGGHNVLDLYHTDGVVQGCILDEGQFNSIRLRSVSKGIIVNTNRTSGEILDDNASGENTEGHNIEG